MSKLKDALKIVLIPVLCTWILLSLVVGVIALPVFDNNNAVSNFIFVLMDYWYVPAVILGVIAWFAVRSHTHELEIKAMAAAAVITAIINTVAPIVIGILMPFNLFWMGMVYKITVAIIVMIFVFYLVKKLGGRHE